MQSKAQTSLKKKSRPLADRPGDERQISDSALTASVSATVEGALYLGAVLLGVLARLFLLDQRPLTVEEGSFAAQAYRLMLGQMGEALRDGPLPTYGAAMALGLFGGGDSAARALSVVFGGILVAVPYLLRANVGRTTALLTAYLFALSPVLLYASRAVGSGILPAALSLLLWWAAVEGAKSRGWRPFAVAVLLASLVASGPTGVTSLLALGLAALLSHPEPAILVSDLRSAAGSSTWRKAALLFLASALAMGAGFGYYLGGVQAVLVDVWTTWLGSFSLQTPRGGPLLLLALYELPILLLALGGLIATLLRRERTDMFLSLWAMVLLLVGMVQPSTGLSRVVLALVPLYILAARVLAASLPLARNASTEWRWVVGAVAVTCPVLVAIVMLNRATILGQEVPQEYMYGELALVLLAVLIFVLIVPAGRRLSLAWWVLAVAATAFWFHTTVFLNYRQETAPSEILMGQQLSPQLRQVATDASYFSAYYDARVVVDPQLRQQLEWYLRRAKAVEYSSQSRQGIGIALASAEAGLPVGSERAPGVYYPSLEGRGLTWQGLWSWAMAREGLVRPDPRDIIFRTPAGIW